MNATRRHDPEGSRAAIFEAAQRLFLERGVAGTSMSDIAKLSGMTKSLIHHHYGSKEDLWNEVKRTAFTTYFEQQKALLQASVEPNAELMRASMIAYFRFLQHNPHVLRLLAWMQLEGDKECVAMIEELTSHGVERIRLAQEAGVLRNDLPAPFVLTAFVGIIQVWFQEREYPHTQNALGDFEDPDSAYLEAAWNLFADGVVRS